MPSIELVWSGGPHMLDHQRARWLQSALGRLADRVASGNAPNEALFWDGRHVVSMRSLWVIDLGMEGIGLSMGRLELSVSSGPWEPGVPERAAQRTHRSDIQRAAERIALVHELAVTLIGTRLLSPREEAGRTVVNL